MDDVAEEILVRLPVESLARCKALSKNANDLISRNPSFHQQYSSINPGCSIMFGFFHSLARPYEDYKVQTVHFSPTTTLGRRRNSTSFTSNKSVLSLPFPMCDESLSFLGLGAVHVAGSSNGFLLCTLQIQYPMNYFICNPMTKQWFPLPEPSYTSQIVAHGFLWQSADNYTIVRGMESDDMDEPDTTLIVEIFSPQTTFQKWSLLKFTCPCSFTFHLFAVSTAVINCDGVIYLPIYFQRQTTQSVAENYSLLIIDQRKEEMQCLQMMEFPRPEGHKYSSRLFGQSKEYILYAFYEQALQRLKVFFLDESARAWSLMHNIRLEMATQYNLEQLVLAAFHPTNPQFIILKFHPEVVLCDLGNSTMELICDFYKQGWHHDYYTYPYTCGLIGPHLFFDD